MGAQLVERQFARHRQQQLIHRPKGLGHALRLDLDKSMPNCLSLR